MTIAPHCDAAGAPGRTAAPTAGSAVDDRQDAHEPGELEQPRRGVARGEGEAVAEAAVGAHAQRKAARVHEVDLAQVEQDPLVGGCAALDRLVDAPHAGDV